MIFHWFPLSASVHAGLCGHCAGGRKIHWASHLSGPGYGAADNESSSGYTPLASS